MIQFSPGKLAVYGRVLMSTACVALERKTSDEIRIITFVSKSFGENKINEL
jgi:hypothetical protein